MAKKSVALLLVLGHEYVRHSSRDFAKETLGACGAYVCKKKKLSHAESVGKLPYAEMNGVFEKMMNCYIPLLNMFGNLERAGVDFKVSLVLTPVLCSLLSDDDVRQQFVLWLDEKIAVGNKEIERLKENLPLLNNAKLCLEKAVETKIDFVEVYGCNLLSAFAKWKEKGRVELLATTGTNIFLPHFSDMAEVVRAQIETGVMAHKYFFGELPSGFWLPELGYAEGLEKYVASYGFEYMVLDAQSVLFAAESPESGVFAPMQLGNSLRAVARLNEFDELICGENGYAANGAYRAVERDIGFYLESGQISPLVKEGCARFTTGYSYWNKAKTFDDVSRIGDAEGESVYDVEAALAQCESDAADFAVFAERKLAAAERLLPAEEEIGVLCALDVGRLCEAWDESLLWLESTMRKLDRSLGLALAGSLARSKRLPQQIKAYPAAWCGKGYGENLLSGKNGWMMRFLRKACERMVDLTEIFPLETGLRSRLLNLGARELLLALSSGWQRMVDLQTFPEYAKKQFAYFILSFTNVFESLGSNHVSTEWLTRMEFEHPIFPWLNYRVFSKKK